MRKPFHYHSPCACHFLGFSRSVLAVALDTEARRLVRGYQTSETGSEWIQSGCHCMTRCMEIVSGKNGRLGAVPIEITTASCPLKLRVLIEVRGESSAVVECRAVAKSREDGFEETMVRSEVKWW